jgi:hypothetical protein
MASLHIPQSVPAPQTSPTASTLRAPERTAASISRSVTHLQMQRTIESRPVEIDTDSQHQQDNTPDHAIQDPAVGENAAWKPRPQESRRLTVTSP